VLYGQRILPVDGATRQTLGPAFKRRSPDGADLMIAANGTGARIAGGTYATFSAIFIRTGVQVLNPFEARIPATVSNAPPR